MAARITEPQVNAGGNVRTAVERDDAGVVNHLIEDDDGIRRLNDLVAVVVGAGQHGRTGGGPVQAALGKAAVFGAIGRMHPLVFGARRHLGLTVRRERRNAAVRRIDDQGGAVGLDNLGAAVIPEFVVGARDVGVGAGAVTA